MRITKTGSWEELDHELINSSPPVRSKMYSSTPSWTCLHYQLSVLTEMYALFILILYQHRAQIYVSIRMLVHFRTHCMHAYAMQIFMPHEYRENFKYWWIFSFQHSTPNFVFSFTQFLCQGKYLLTLSEYLNLLPQRGIQRLQRTPAHSKNP